MSNDEQTIKLSRILPIILILIVFSGGAFIQLDKSITPAHSCTVPYVKIGDKEIKVTVADEPQEHWQGLSDRKFLGSDNGMLFVFPQKQVRSFWMKNMHFPLDIIWIEDNRIIKIHKRLKPEGEEPENRYSSGQAINYVLEVNGGFADAFGIKEGDIIEFNTN